MKAATRSPARSPAFPFLAGMFLGLVLLCQAMLAHAQPDDVDPPARAARVGEVVGDAWVYDSENREWIRLLRNQTLGQGDRLRTDERARVSLRIGSTSLWVDERSDLAFNQLDEGRTVVELEHGDIGLRLRSGESATDTRVRTREGDMVPEREGLYRVEQLGDDSASRAYVWQGRMRFEPARGDGDIPPTVLQGGEQAEFWWAGGGPRVERQRLASDGFGDWISGQRDGDIAVAQRYVSPEMTGIEDLDRNGRWEQSPDYGTLWIPTAVATDWAPYRDGHWVWSRNWGWTWVDDAPWGFAPFHYGRWVSYRGRWCWAPGSYVARPVYAPALVAWVGGGSFSVSVNVGGGRPPPPRFGWYPLAPREVYRPPYRHSPIYVERINGGDRDHRGGGPRGNWRPPQSNLTVAGAVSFLPGQGGPVRALPPGEVRQLRPLPTPTAAPSRQEFARVLPQRPPSEVRAPGEMPAWRGRGDNNRGPERGADRGDRGDRGGDRSDFRPGGPRGREPDATRPAMPSPLVQQQPQQQPQPQQPQQQQPQTTERPQRDWQHQAERLQRERAQQQQQQPQQQQQQDRAQQEQRAQQDRQNQMERQNQDRARAAEAQQRQRQQERAQQQQERAQQEQQRAQQEQQRAQQQDRQNQMERQNQERARAAEAQQRQQQQAQQQQQPRPQPQAQPQPQPQPQAQQPRRDDGERARRDRDDGDRRGRAPQQQER